MRRLIRSAAPFAACLALALASPTACGDDDTSGATDTASSADAVTGDATGGDVEADTAAAADTATPPPACNPILQTGCEADQNCTFGPNDSSPSCVAEGTVAYGEECGGNDAQCERGICMSINDTGNRCYKFCQTVAHCEAQRSCLTLTGTVYKVCQIPDLYDNCDLLAQDCEGGKGCYPVASEPEPICLAAGAATTGAVCENADGCVPGNLCINQRCKRICDRTAADPCGNFTPCVNYAGDAGYCDE